MGLAVDEYVSAENTPVGLIARVPQLVAEQRDARAIRLVVLGRETSSQDRRRAEEETGPRTRRRRSGVLARRRRRRSSWRCPRLAAIVANAVVASFQSRMSRYEQPAFIARALILLPENQDSIGVAVRIGLQQHPVDDAENGGVEADAESKAQNGDRREGLAVPGALTA